MPLLINEQTLGPHKLEQFRMIYQVLFKQVDNSSSNPIRMCVFYLFINILFSQILRPFVAEKQIIKESDNISEGLYL